MDRYDLVLGMAQTNYLGLAEHLLLMQAGHCHWTSLARAVNTPMSTLRTVGGQEIYATFYFIEERFPDHALPSASPPIKAASTALMANVVAPKTRPSMRAQRTS